MNATGGSASTRRGATTLSRVLALIVALLTVFVGSLMLATTASADKGGTPNDHASSAPGQTEPGTPDVEVPPGTHVDTDHPDKGGGNDATKDQSPGNSGFHKVSICHWTGNAGWIVITMSENAWAAHEKHQGSKDDFVTTTGYCSSDQPTMYGGCYNIGGQYVEKAAGTMTYPEDAAGMCNPAKSYSGCYLTADGYKTLEKQAAPSTLDPALCTTGGTSTTGETSTTPLPGVVETTEETAVTPLPATIQPQPATVIPPKAATAGDGSTVPSIPTAAWILLLTGALGVLGTGTKLVTTK